MQRGAEFALSSLGRVGDFLDDPRVRIPLPGFRDHIQVLRFIGLQPRVVESVIAMNRAAETAVPQSLDLLVAAVRTMSVDDGRRT